MTGVVDPADPGGLGVATGRPDIVLPLPQRPTLPSTGGDSAGWGPAGGLNAAPAESALPVSSAPAPQYDDAQATTATSAAPVQAIGDGWSAPTSVGNAPPPSEGFLSKAQRFGEQVDRGVANAFTSRFHALEHAATAIPIQSSIPEWLYKTTTQAGAADTAAATGEEVPSYGDIKQPTREEEQAQQQVERDRINKLQEEVEKRWQAPEGSATYAEAAKNNKLPEYFGHQVGSSLETMGEYLASVGLTGSIIPAVIGSSIVRMDETAKKYPGDVPAIVAAGTAGAAEASVPLGVVNKLPFLKTAIAKIATTMVAMPGVSVASGYLDKVVDAIGDTKGKGFDWDTVRQIWNNYKAPTGAESKEALISGAVQAVPMGVVAGLHGGEQPTKTRNQPLDKTIVDPDEAAALAGKPPEMLQIEGPSSLNLPRIESPSAIARPGDVPPGVVTPPVVPEGTMPAVSNVTPFTPPGTYEPPPLVENQPPPPPQGQLPSPGNIPRGGLPPGAVTGEAYPAGTAPPTVPPTVAPITEAVPRPGETPYEPPGVPQPPGPPPPPSAGALPPPAALPEGTMPPGAPRDIEGTPRAGETPYEPPSPVTPGPPPPAQGTAGIPRPSEGKTKAQMASAVAKGNKPMRQRLMRMDMDSVRSAYDQTRQAEAQPTRDTPPPEGTPPPPPDDGSGGGGLPVVPEAPAPVGGGGAAAPGTDPAALAAASAAGTSSTTGIEQTITRVINALPETPPTAGTSPSVAPEVRVPAAAPPAPEGTRTEPLPAATPAEAPLAAAPAGETALLTKTAPAAQPTVEGLTVEPDHLDPNRHVVKDETGNVIAMGPSPELALQRARQDRQASGATPAAPTEGTMPRPRPPTVVPVGRAGTVVTGEGPPAPKAAPQAFQLAREVAQEGARQLPARGHVPPSGVATRGEATGERSPQTSNLERPLGDTLGALLEQAPDEKSTPEQHKAFDETVAQAHEAHPAQTGPGRPRLEPNASLPNFVAAERRAASDPQRQARLQKRIEKAQQRATDIAQGKETPTDETNKTLRKENQWINRELERTSKERIAKLDEIAKRLPEPTAEEPTAKSAPAAEEPVTAKSAPASEEGAASPERQSLRERLRKRNEGMKPSTLEGVRDEHSAVNDAVDEAVRAGGAKLHDLLTAVARKVPSLAATARRLRQLLPDTNVEHLAGEAATISGGYEPSTGRIHLATGETPGVRPRGETIVHEAIHKATLNYINHLVRGQRLTPEQLRHREALDILTEETRRASDAHDPRTGGADTALDLLHAGSDPHEAVAMSSTNARVREVLRNHEPSPENSARLRALGFEGKGNLWSQVKDWVRRVLRLPRKATSFLDVADQIGREVIDQGAKFGRDTGAFHEDVVNQATDHAMQHLPLEEPSRRAQVAEAARVGLSRADPRRAVRVATTWAGSLSGITDAYAPVVDRLLRVKNTAEANSEPWSGVRTNPLREYQEATGRQFGTTEQTIGKYAANATALMQRFRNAPESKAIGQLMNDATLNGVHLDDFPGANSHLRTPEQQATAAEIKGRFNALSPDDQETVRGFRRQFAALDSDKRQSSIVGLLRSFVPDLTDSEANALRDQVKTRKGLDDLARNPASTSVANVFGKVRWDEHGSVVGKLAELANQGKVPGDYFRLGRQGDWVVSYGGDGPGRGVEFFDSKHEAEQRRAELVKAGEEPSQAFHKSEKEFDRTAYSSTLADQLAHELGQRGASEETINQAKQGMHEILRQHVSDNMAARLRLQRKGVRGASTDAARTLGDTVVRDANAIGQSEWGWKRQKAISDLDTMLKSLRDVPNPEEITIPANATPEQRKVLENQQRLARELAPSVANREKIEAARNALERHSRIGEMNQSNAAKRRIIAHATRMAYYYTIDRIARPIIDTLSTQNTAWNFQAARHGYARTSMEMTKALAQLTPAGTGEGLARAFRRNLIDSDWHYGKALMDRVRGKTSGMDLKLVNALDSRINSTDLLGHSFAQIMRSFTKPGTTLQDPALRRIANLHQPFSGLMDRVGIMEQAISDTNVLSTALSAARLEHRRLGGKEEHIAPAVEHAIDFVRRMPSNFAPSNRAALVAKFPAPMQFRAYGLNALGLLANTTRDAFKGETQPQRSEARKALANTLASQTLLAGGLAAPVVGQIPGLNELWNLTTGIWDMIHGKKQPHNYEAGTREWLARTIGNKTAAEILARGVPSALGVNLNNSLTTGNLLNIPRPSSFTQGDLLGWLGQLYMGASGDQTIKAVSSLPAVGEPTEEGERALGVYMPRAARDIYEAARTLHEGIRDTQGRVIRPASQITVPQAVLRGAGFQPSSWAESREGYQAGLQERFETRDEGRRLSSIYLQSPTGANMADIQHFNRANPGWAVNVPDLMKQLAERRSGRPPPVPPKQRQVIQRAGSFANP